MSGQMLNLRPYQAEGVDAVFTALARGMRRPAVVWPTGAGKTVGFAHIARRWRAQHPDTRVLVLAHTTELVDQAIAKMRSVAPGERVGRVQGNTNETLARIVCASVQTLRSENRRRMIRDVGLIIVDECHHAVASTYLQVLEHYGAMGSVAADEGAVAVGFTATMMRGDDKALGAVWQDIVHQVSISDMIGMGFLVRPRGLHVEVDDLDLSQVRTMGRGGDYREGDLGQAIEDSLAPQAIAKAVAEHAPDRKLILFAPTVSSAGVIADALNASGRPTGLVHGGMAAGERKSVLDAYRARETPILANCQLATEGFDDPETDGVVIARPTRSPVLYRQMAGRALRPWPGKTDALLLDVVGATKAHSLVSGVELFGETPDDTPKKKPLDADILEIGLEDPDELAPGQQDARAALLAGRDGKLIATEVDLFAGSSMAWLRTRAGVFFIEAGERYLMIVPGAPKRADQWLTHFSGGGGGPGRFGFDVMSVSKTGPVAMRQVVDGVEDLAYAMAWAEGDVTASEKTTATKERAWRARPPSSSPKLMALASRLGVFIPPGARMGEVSNMVSLVLASKRIDPLLGSWTMKGK